MSWSLKQQNSPIGRSDHLGAILGLLCSKGCLSGSSDQGLLLPPLHPSLCIPNYKAQEVWGHHTGLQPSSPPHPVCLVRVHRQHKWGAWKSSHPYFPLSSPGSGAPTLIEDELLHALLLLVGSLQTLRCALQDTLLFGQSGSQFQKFPL